MPTDKEVLAALSTVADPELGKDIVSLRMVDEVAGASELVSGKLAGVPATVVRGVAFVRGESGAKELVMEPERDLFR